MSVGVCTPQRYSPLVVVLVVGLVEEEALWAPE